MLLWVSLTLQHRSTIHSPFSSRLIMSNFSSLLIVFCQFFIWIALGDADSCFSLMLVRNANAVEEETTWAFGCITNVITPYMWRTAWQWCHFLLSSYRRCLVATDRLCQIMLNQKLSHKLKNKCKPSSCVKTKSHKKKSHKTRLACMLLHSNRQLTNSFIAEQLGSCGNILTVFWEVLGWLHQLSWLFFFCSCLHSFWVDLWVLTCFSLDFLLPCYFNLSFTCHPAISCCIIWNTIS